MASEQPDRRRVRVVYRGRVQGVGFRFTTLGISRNFDLSGYVRNMPDGSVELEAQGKPETVDAFLDGVAAAMASNISIQNRERIAPLTDAAAEDFELRI